MQRSGVPAATAGRDAGREALRAVRHARDRFERTIGDVEGGGDEDLADGGVQIAAAARLSVADNAAADPRRGFAHAGEFFKALISVPMGEGSARPGYALGGKLHFGQMQAAAPGTFGGEGLCDARADALRSAGDEHLLACQSEVHAVRLAYAG